MNTSIVNRVLKAKNYSELPDRKVIIVNSKTYVSYGVICWCKENDSWLLVRPQHSYGFRMLLQSSRRKSELDSILTNTTKYELELLYDFLTDKIPFPYYELCLRHSDINISSVERIYAMKDILIDKIPRFQGLPDPPWTFPKGRLEKGEAPFQCALREFYEESGINLTECGSYIVSPTAVCEKYISFDQNWYETQCWIFCVQNVINLFPPTPMGIISEISDRKWVKTQDIKKYISDSKYSMFLKALDVIKSSNL